MVRIYIRARTTGRRPPRRHRCTTHGPPPSSLPAHEFLGETEALAMRRRVLNGLAETQGWPSWNLAREEARSLLNETPLP
jgi:hypothetical protein